MVSPSDLEKYWETFVTSRIINENVRPIIADSWKRSVAYGIDPYKDYVGQKIEESDFARILDHNHELITVAVPVMEQMHNIVEGSGFTITLTDKDENILESLGDPNTLNISRSLNFEKGYKWGEKIVGTCLTTLCIMYDQPIQAVGAEHFPLAHHMATSSSAPIHNVHGEIIGTLSMAGLVENVTKHTLGIVTASVLNVEKQLELRGYNHLINVALRTISEGIIVTDLSFRIVIINSVASKIFGKDSGEIAGKDIRKIFKDINYEKIRNGGYKIEDKEIVFDMDDIQSAVFLNMTAMFENNSFLGVSVIFREAQKVKSLINKAVGNEARYTFESIITKNEKMLKMIAQAKKIAKSNCSVLISGESGTGKELFAQSLHNASGRASGPFVAVNCAALPRELIESELFGYESGAFTGASKGGKPGKFELADGGTIFLDEIGELPLDVQSKLLRVLDSHKVTRIGASREKNLDVRVIAATNRDLFEESRQKNFRSDLYYRLNVVSFNLIPLRERKDDIPILADHFLDKLKNENPSEINGISEGLFSVFYAYEWKGNIREFQNVISRAYFLCSGVDLTEDLMPLDLKISIENEPTNSGSTQKLLIGNEIAESEEVLTVNERERKAIIQALRKRNGNAVLAALDLGIGKSTVYRKMKKYHITLDELCR